MEQQDIISKLEAKGIKPTANRILVLKTLASEAYMILKGEKVCKVAVHF